MRTLRAEFVTSAFGADDFIRDDRRQVAFGGRSNVGKSTLLNRMLGVRGIARTSSAPGRTRSVNYFLIEQRFYFVDLPGYGYAKVRRTEREAWGRLVERYLESSQDRLEVVLLIDAKIAGSPLDAQAIEYFFDVGVDPIVVATKIDRVPRSKRPACLATIAGLLGLPNPSRIIPVSAQTGEGIPALWNALTVAA